MAVPYAFGNATTSLPLSQLDSNFNTPITLGNTVIILGETKSSIGNVTLTNTTVNNYTETVSSANSSTAYSVNLSNGTFHIVTLTANATVTMPAATSGKSFLLLLKQDGTGGRTVTWSTVKWPSATIVTGKQYGMFHLIN